jgi:hypothetical protein
VRKDAFAIQSKHDAGELLSHAREMDREFVAKLERFPLVRLRIPYEDVEPIRRQRMERLLEAALELLGTTPWRGIRAAARAHYSRAQFEARVREHLRLYAAEVHALSRSVRPALLVAPWRERLRALMERQADALAHEVAHVLYRAMR